MRCVQLDVLDKDAIARVIGAMPAIDVLFNCAGFVHGGTVLQATDEEWNFALNLNVRAQFWAIQAALPRMLQNQGGQGAAASSTWPACAAASRACPTASSTAPPRRP